MLRPKGKLALIDMEAAGERLREREDEIETWRDSSHVWNLSREEIQSLFHEHSLKITKCKSTKIPVNLCAWMDLTITPDFMRKKIRKDMQGEIARNLETGFSPYQKDGEIYFDQRLRFFSANSDKPGIHKMTQDKINLCVVKRRFL